MAVEAVVVAAPAALEVVLVDVTEDVLVVVMDALAVRAVQVVLVVPELVLTNAVQEIVHLVAYHHARFPVTMDA